MAVSPPLERVRGRSLPGALTSRSPGSLTPGYRMPGWFDVITFDRSVSPRPEDEAGILATVEAVDALIQAEVDAGIPENRIVLGGFSQGGAIAVLSQLLGKRKLAGYVSLSTWVPLAHKVEGMARKDAKDFPLFWGHGRDDEIVQYDCEWDEMPPSSSSGGWARSD